MDTNYDLVAIAGKIQSLKKAAMELADLGEDFPALYRNARRILAAVKMLEINISDVSDTTSS
ncbi:MAG: hypothetical protein R6X27_00565 [Candidatus Desulfacyla sp.]|jgi:hypothetical protein